MPEYQDDIRILCLHEMGAFHRSHTQGNGVSRDFTQHDQPESYLMTPAISLHLPQKQSFTNAVNVCVHVLFFRPIGLFTA